MDTFLLITDYTDKDTNLIFLDEDKKITYVTASSHHVVELLNLAHRLIGHDIIKQLYAMYDDNVLVLDRLKDLPIFDTYIYNKIHLPNSIPFDAERADRGIIARKHINCHSLTAWLYRINSNAKKDKINFNTSTQFETLKHMFDSLSVMHANYYTAVDTENRVAEAVGHIENTGFYFNTKKAQNLADELTAELKLIATDINKQLIALHAVKLINNFNPLSNQQLTQLITDYLYIKLTDITEKKNYVVTDAVLKEIPSQIVQSIRNYRAVNKQLSLLSHGDNALLKLQKNNIIYGRIDPLGTISCRATHNTPNLAQIPKKKEYRELFTTPHGYKLLGVDLAGIELRCLGHYMFKYDRGLYCNEIVNGDIHTFNQEKATLATRDQAKTFIYALIYGASYKELANIAGITIAEAKQKKQSLIANIPALEKLIKETDRLKNDGFITTIDNRKLKIRHQHATLNLRLQSAGAIIAKLWLAFIYTRIKKSTVDAKICVWVHDELQFIVKNDASHITMLETIINDSLHEVQAELNFNCILDCTIKSGDNWNETH